VRHLIVTVIAVIAGMLKMGTMTLKIIAVNMITDVMKVA